MNRFLRLGGNSIWYTYLSVKNDQACRDTRASRHLALINTELIDRSRKGKLNADRGRFALGTV